MTGQSLSHMVAHRHPSNSKIENKLSRNIQISVRLFNFHRKQSQTHWRKKMPCQKSQLFIFLLDSLWIKWWPLGPWPLVLFFLVPPSCYMENNEAAATSSWIRLDFGTYQGLIRSRWLFDMKWLLLSSLTQVLSIQLSANTIFTCDTNSASLIAPITAMVWVLPDVNEGMLGTPLRRSQVL